jgi:hypothetical protein
VELYARVRPEMVIDKMRERDADTHFGPAREALRKMLRYSVPPHRRQQPVTPDEADAGSELSIRACSH